MLEVAGGSPLCAGAAVRVRVRVRGRGRGTVRIRVRRSLRVGQYRDVSDS